MTRILFTTAFLLGAAAIAWMGSGFAGTNALAFAVTAVIGGVYIIGIVELFQFRQATATLDQALATIPPRSQTPREWLDKWLQRLDPSLQNSVRLRIEGERVGLPAAVFAPYLVGLLVMLGLLGTFVGMVDTLSGAVRALEGSTELEAIRAGLAAPIQGLGVAFGTSVAGVSASAMLGLISTLVRRDRMLATRQLDSVIATVFKEFSLTHNRQETYQALQAQAQALPAVAETLQTLASHLATMGTQLGDKLLSNQSLFHEATEKRYNELATAVGKSLCESLAASGQAAGESIRPVLAEALAEINATARNSHEQFLSSAQSQLLSFENEFRTTSSTLLQAFGASSASWAEQSLTLQTSISQSMTESTRELTDSSRTIAATLLEEIGSLVQSNEQLVAARQVSETAWLKNQNIQMGQLTAALSSGLGELRDQEERAQAGAAKRMAELESSVASHLTRLGAGLEEPMTRLIQTASETPRAAAEVIGQLRSEISNNIARDNTLLAERQRAMTDLHSLASCWQQAANEQREAVANLVTSSASTLQEISTRFGDHLSGEAARIAEASAEVAGSASELSSVGEAFGVAVNLFYTANETLIDHLSRIEVSMERSTARSDEQMAYYVAQAREIIDQSMLSHKEILADLAQAPKKGRSLAAEAG